IRGSPPGGPAALGGSTGLAGWRPSPGLEVAKPGVIVAAVLVGGICRFSVPARGLAAGWYWKTSRRFLFTSTTWKHDLAGLRSLTKRAHAPARRTQKESRNGQTEV